MQKKFKGKKKTSASKINEGELKSDEVVSSPSSSDQLNIIDSGRFKANKKIKIV